MGDIIFLNPSIVIPGDITTLTQLCKDTLLSKLFCQVVDEELCPIDNTDTIFDAKNINWFAAPTPKIKKINTDGSVTLLFSSADYTVDLVGGRITLTSALTEGQTLTASYTFFPFTDTQLNQILEGTVIEISVLTYRPIDTANILQDYRPVICKRFYTNILKTLIIEARDFFSVTVAGRTINKTVIVPQINTIIDQNERQVLSDINILRHFNKTNRILPRITVTKTLISDTEIVP